MCVHARVHACVCPSLLLPILLLSREPHFRCPGIDNPDYKLFPNKEFQCKWLRAYLEETAELKGEDPAAVKEADVEKMYIEVSKFVPVSVCVEIVLLTYIFLHVYICNGIIYII